MKRVDFGKIISYFNFGVFKKTEINSSRDWKIILAASVFLLAILLLFDGYVFWEYKKSLNSEIEAEYEFTGVDNESLQKVLKDIERREAKFNAILKSPRLEDPSL